MDGNKERVHVAFACGKVSCACVNMLQVGSYAKTSVWYVGQLHMERVAIVCGAVWKLYLVQWTGSCLDDVAFTVR